MLQKEERSKFEIPPIVQLCYTHIVPIRKDRMLATAGPKMVLIDIDGHEIFQYKFIRLAEYSDVEEIPKYLQSNVQQESEWNSLVERLNNDEFIDTTNYVDDILVFQDGHKYGVVDYDGNIILDLKCFSLEFKRDTDGSTIVSHLP